MFSTVEYEERRALLGRVMDAQNALRDYVGAATQQLFRAVAECAAKERKAQLLKEKRRVERLLRIVPTSAAPRAEAGVAFPDVKRWVDARDAGIMRLSDVSAASRRLGELARRAAQSEPFTVSLALTSLSFYDRLCNLAKSGRQIAPQSQDAATLIKYVTRACFKTSPFSQFTTIAPIVIESEGPKCRCSPFPMEHEQKLATHVEPNNVILQPLLELMRAGVMEFGGVPLEWTDAFYESDGYLYVLSNLSGTEEVARVENGPLLSGLYAKFSKKASISASEVREWLFSECGLEPDAAHRIVVQLVDAGVLVQKVNMGWYSGDAISGALELLNRNKLAGELVLVPSLLRKIASSCSLIARSAADQRASILSELGRVYQAYLSEVDRATVAAMNRSPGGAQGRIKPRAAFVSRKEALVYETSVKPLSEPRDMPHVPEWAAILSAVVRHLRKLALNTGHNCDRYYRFARSYAGDRTTVPLLEIAAEAGAGIGALEQGGDWARKKEWDSAISEERASFKAFFAATVHAFSRATKADGHKIDLVADDDVLLSPAEKGSPFRTLGVAAQETGFAEGPQIVLNALYNGTGIAYTRFVPLLGKRFHEAVYIDADESEPAYAELRCGGITNVNNFPAITPYEILGPRVAARAETASAIPLADLDVLNENGVLSLRSRRLGRRVIPVTVSLETRAKLRSVAFSILESFTPWTPSLQYIASVAEQFAVARTRGGEIVADTPAITLHNKLLIRRRRIYVNAPLLEKKLSLGGRDAKVRSILSWVIENGVPLEVFVRFSEKDIKRANDPLPRKPQFIAFADEASVYIFSRLISKAKSNVILEEAVPFSTRPGCYAEEFAMEW